MGKINTSVHSSPDPNLRFEVLGCHPCFEERLAASSSARSHCAASTHARYWRRCFTQQGEIEFGQNDTDEEEALPVNIMAMETTFTRTDLSEADEKRDAPKRPDFAYILR